MGIFLKPGKLRRLLFYCQTEYGLFWPDLTLFVAQKNLKLFFANALTDYFHAWQDGVFFKNIFSIPAFRFMQFLGTYRGFNQRGAVTENLRGRFYYPNGLFREKIKTTGKKEAGSERRIKYEHH